MTDDSLQAAGILRRRAEQLAQEPVAVQDSSEQIEVIPFRLASELYAFETRWVREVWPLQSILPIPHTPSFVKGVANVHGEICSVVDLREFFNLPFGGLTNLNKLVILENDSMSFGILADDVLGSRQLPADTLSSVDGWNGIQDAYVQGVTEDRLIVLNGQQILTDRQLIVNDAAKA